MDIHTDSYYSDYSKCSEQDAIDNELMVERGKRDYLDCIINETLLDNQYYLAGIILGIKYFTQHIDTQMFGKSPSPSDFILDDEF